MARSLRTRVVVGAFLATVGTLTVGHLIAFGLWRHFHVGPVAHWVAISFISFACIVAGLVHVHTALSPFGHLRRRLAAVREGRTTRVEGEYPSEVQPLVDDLNALLDDRERRVAQAHAKAGDLAHGLKTPLAVLFQEADIARAHGHHELADTLDQQVERMQRQVDYHLAGARAAGSGPGPGVRSSVAQSVEGLTRTLLRLHAGKGLAIHSTVSAGDAVHARREDLDEMLGNLLDNACTWARSQVTVSTSREDEALVIVIDDDGAGIDPALWDVVLRRGARADEAVAGDGLGLAIVRDLAELHGGSIALGRAPQGGARATLRLPAA